MLHTQDIYPFCKQLLEDWDTYLILLDKGESRKTPLTKREKQVHERIDQSLPIIIETKISNLKLEEPSTYFVRVLKHKVEGICIDIRKFNKKSNGDTNWYEPTEVGLMLPIGSWFKIVDPLFKLLRKHKTNE